MTRRAFKSDMGLELKRGYCGEKEKEGKGCQGKARQGKTRQGKARVSGLMVIFKNKDSVKKRNLSKGSCPRQKLYSLISSQHV